MTVLTGGLRAMGISFTGDGVWTDGKLNNLVQNFFQWTLSGVRLATTVRKQKIEKQVK